MSTKAEPTTSSYPKRTAPAFTSVGIPLQTHRDLVKAAKHWDMSLAQFTKAAISYFTTRGLNPTVEPRNCHMLVQDRVDKRTGLLENQLAKASQQILDFLKAHESNLYAFHQAQAEELMHYLQHLEKDLFVPLMHEVIRGGSDALLARRSSLYSVLILQNNTTELAIQNQQRDEMRDQLMRERLAYLSGATTTDS